VSEPIKAGDLAKVVSGLHGDKSPNIGLIVKVVAFAGEHTKLGRIWTCDAEYAIRGQEGHNRREGLADFAQSWLKKIDPEAGKTNTETKEELTV
jgi:hypothetical protein